MAEPSGSRDLPQHVTTPLLTLLTQRSLDADYEHVAARRRESGQDGSAHPVPRRTAALVLLAFGLLVTVAAVQTSRDASVKNASRSSLIAQVELRRKSVSDLQRTLSQEQSHNVSLQHTSTVLAAQVQAADAKVAHLKARTGFGEVRGPGIQVSVNGAPGGDATQMVRDSDLSLLTDALWAAGAEAISVNGQRLTVLSSFRNVGIAVLVNSQPVNPPYVFDVIGNPNTLQGDLLASPAGARWYTLKNSLGFRFAMKPGGTMTLPAAPPPRLRSARIMTEKDMDTRTQGDGAS